MEADCFGLCVKETDGKIVNIHPIPAPLHDVKSFAGYLFHSDVVTSVCVFDAVGTSCLYLKKDETGKCIMREENEPLTKM
jgi:hypothetical protein